jgi:hypothetical protein
MMNEYCALAVPISAAKKLQSLLEADDEIIFCPGVYEFWV